MFKGEREILDGDILREILRRGRFTILALCREDEPYIVTLSYGYDEKANCLYFHTALKGAKLLFIESNDRACATVIEDKGYVQGECRHCYRSLVLAGRMKLVTELEEKKHGFEVLLDHLESDPRAPKAKYLPDEGSYSRAHILRLDIEEIRGKEGR